MHRENEAVLQYCVDHQITFIPYFPLASGILAGKYDENTKFSDHRTTRRDFKPGVFEENVRRVKALESIAAAHQTSIANIVLAFYLTRPAIDVIILVQNVQNKSLKILKLQISFYQMMRFNISMNCFQLKTK